VEWKGLFALHYFTKEIIDLKSELEEIEASPNMQQKKKEIQEKLIKIWSVQFLTVKNQRDIILKSSLHFGKLEQIKEEL